MSIQLNPTRSVGGAPWQAAAASAARGSLLPSPVAIPSDDLSAIFALMSKNRQIGLRQSIKDVRHAQAARSTEWKRVKTALAKALRAKKKGGFWRKLAKNCLKIAKVAIVAAAIAAAVASGGAGAPIVILAWSGAAMSSAAFVQGECHVLQKLGMSDSAAGWTEAGLAIAGGAATGGTGLAAQGSLAMNLSRAATVAAAGAGVAGGVATIEASKYEAEAEDHMADAVQAKAAEQFFERMIAVLVSDLEHSEKSDERALGQLRGAIQAKGECLVAAGKQV